MRKHFHALTHSDPRVSFPSHMYDLECYQSSAWSLFIMVLYNAMLFFFLPSLGVRHGMRTEQKEGHDEYGPWTGEDSVRQKGYLLDISSSIDLLV